MMPAAQAGVPAWRAPLIVGIALLLLATVTMTDAFRITAGTGPGVGPSAAMKLIAVLLGVLGAAHLLSAVRAFGKSAAPEWGTAVNPRGLAWVLGGLIAQIAVLAAGAGFIAASAILFIATSRGFGRPLLSRGPIYGIVLSTAVFLFFTKALSLTLPAGPLERLLFA